MISKKSIIALAAVVVLLIGTFVGLSFMDTEEKKPISTESTSIELFTTTTANILRMDLIVDDESFAFVRSGDKWVLAGNEDVKLKNSSVDYLCSELAGVYAKQCVDEKGENLSIYGFDNPLATYKITMSDGSTKTYLLGNRDVVTGQYYFKLADTAPVYTLYPNKGDAIYKKCDEYKDSNIIDIDMANLTSVRMNSSKFNLELVCEEKGDTAVWNMKQPMNRSTDSEQVNKNLISKLSYITVNEFVDESSESYAQSGVNNPEAVLTLTDKTGATQTLYVGKQVDLQRYVKTNGRVYLINGDSLSFINTDPFIYVNKFINLEKIDEVKKVEVTAKGKTHIATIDGTGETATYKLDGTQVLETKFKREVYQKIIALMADEFAKAPAYSTPEYTITFYMKDGTVKKSEYCAYDDRNYAVYSNGKCEFVIRRKKLEEMFASLENVIADRTQQ